MEFSRLVTPQFKNNDETVEKSLRPQSFALQDRAHKTHPRSDLLWWQF